ncbi:MAG: hypothetical protein OXL37_01975 [Chloroflexota bacterium]|nr:hypothetical protein [Chloroflexota bacterium]MDE2961504.1 hypothetical protein [Chloroflexota bacterium]
MNDQQKERLKALAEFIETTRHPLTSGIWLHTRPYRPGIEYGFSILGLVCLAHEALTGNGRWILSNPNAPELPDYLSEGEFTDRLLPESVVEYFGFRDNAGSFHAGDLPAELKRRMYRTKKTATSSLFAVGLEYPKRRREIATGVIRAMPPSLLKRKPSEISRFPIRLPPRPVAETPGEIKALEPDRAKFRVVPNHSELAPGMDDPKALKQLLDDEDVERYLRLRERGK